MVIRFITTIIVSLCALAAHANTDVNKASKAELEALRGVGPSLSGKILEARKSGEFRNWDDLVERVGGIGPGNAAKLSQAGLTVAGNTYGGATASAPKARKSDTAAQDKPVAQGNKAAADKAR